jgi:anti-sigma regulatory factor (Ser/Thr protein kinase)
MRLEYKIEGGDFGKAGSASSEVKKVLKQININAAIIKRIAVAMYEAEVNVVAHAYNGKMLVDINTNAIKIRLEDKGPGIVDIDKAMEEGFSTASEAVRQMGFGAGMGLPNIKKNVDSLNISSEVGKGTIVELSVLLN